MKQRNLHAEMIEAIGRDVIREHFSLTPQALHQWRLRGVPMLKRVAFSNLARTRGVALPSDFLAPLGIAA